MLFSLCSCLVAIKRQTRHNSLARGGVRENVMRFKNFAVFRDFMATFRGRSVIFHYSPIQLRGKILTLVKEFRLNIDHLLKFCSFIEILPRISQ